MDKAIPEKYDHRTIEPKWVKKWEEEKIYRAVDFDKKPKKYILVEFPYPSGERLHIGHAFAFTGTDILARYFRMKGFNILFPMGWDAFGLPAENYAIKTGINPMITTTENITNSRAQAKSLALSFDWSREISTIDPKYYKWTQWIFLQWRKNGLAYKAEMPINWCPRCKIGLANEEVVAGNCERCGAEVTRRNIKQWVVKITAYADRLLEGLKDTEFIEKVKAAQISWIGRSEGAEITFSLKWEARHGRLDEEVGSGKKESHLSPQYPALHFQPLTSIKVFTTRPDTLYGATFMVLAPEHDLVQDAIRDTQYGGEIKTYIEKAKKKSDLERTGLAREKTGVFSGLYAINPVTGREIPIWISDFVLATYGTGAIMAVPAHDERDWQFAKKFGLPIVPVIKPSFAADFATSFAKASKVKKASTAKEAAEGKWDFNNAAYTEVEKGITVNSPEWNGLKPAEAIKKATLWIEKNNIGKKSVSYHLRDWIFSRQHYWGEPIPIIFCEKCGEVPVPEEDLPVELPKVEKYEPSDTGESPLAAITDWVKTTCPKCGAPAKRETDTMPNWAGSDWYFLRYIDPGNDKALIDLEKAKYWLPVDVYIGGDEHNTLHLLYSRFTYQFLWDIGEVPKKDIEPYIKRVSHGVILGPDGQRMSKSRGNVINPDEMVEAFGADALRVYLMFMGPFEATMAWSQEAMEGCYRFLKRVWSLSLGKMGEQTENGLLRKLNRAIKKATEDIANMKFNTAVAAMMEFINSWQDSQGMAREDVSKFLQILAPFAPFITEELWEKLGFGFSIHNSGWPKYEPSLIEEEMVTIVVQVNGKLRDTIEIQSSRKAKIQKEIEKRARESERVQKYLGGREIKKVVFVSGKLINFVI